MSKIVLSKDSNTLWDVIVIGGGPAGMMAAGKAGERGLSVLLLEKNAHFGKKLLLTGNGRCNITNNKQDVRTMLEYYKDGGKFLFSTFAQHAVKDSIAFFENLAVPLKEENEGRMFPISDSAETVRDALVSFLKNNNVTVQMQSTVTTITKDTESGHFTITLTNGKSLTARTCVVAAGGTSHPETGSTGECFTWLKALGHTTQENEAALVPVAIKDAWIKKLSGLSLPKCKITIYCNEKKHSAQTGKILFTHFGLSGPLVLNMSKKIGEFLTQGPVTLKLDLVPEQDFDTLRANLQTLLINESNRKLKNVLSDFVPSTLVTPLLELANIDGETPNHSVRSEDRRKLVALMKAVPCTVEGLLGADKAIVSSGGIPPTEVYFKTMESRVMSGLYLVGDVLNIDRPSGGYSLQLCWSTGFVAGTHILE
jgi:predicted Rossmann fold flavoprotein